MNRFNVALLQVDSQQDKAANLRKIGGFIDEAARRGADFVSMPEMCAYIARKPDESGNDGCLDNAESVPGPITEFMASKAREHGIWIHGGSIHERIDGAKKTYNTTVVYSPKGDIAAVYRKIHLYDVDVKGGVSYRESDAIEPGGEIVTFDTPYCRMGLAICYDIRFPEVFRILTLRGAKVIFNPAEFALYTGKDHWEALIRARAIENECYMVCAGQIGIKPTMHTYGRSIVVDPWGNVIAKASDKEGVLMAEIDVDYVDKLRTEVPCLSNRRPKTYVWPEN
ncbi:MAG: carbon-nitrogen hydrolase family protein [Synergistaceae bacterium]|nr:carbon-nitrogen hydrolase family protein [Synergistaceae bacterium]